MVTELISMPDWQEVLKGIGWADAPTAGGVEEAVLRELTRGKAYFVEQDPALPIQDGCRVTLRTRSALPKFNKEKTVVTVGTHLYDPEIEARLRGMTVGSSAQTVVRGETVAFTVLKVERKACPPLTDALVEDLRLEHITTLDQYRAFMRDKLTSEYAEKLCAAMTDALLAKMQPAEAAEEDIRQATDREYEPLCARFKLENMSCEEWRENFGDSKFRDFYRQIYPDIALLFGTTCKEDYYASRRKDMIRRVRTCLALRSILGEETDETDPTIALDAEQKLVQAMAKRLRNMVYGGS